MQKTYSVNIHIKLGDLNDHIKWCQDNCVSNWTYEIISSAGRDPGEYVFNFKSSSDLINFGLVKS